ncbi:uncharacterized protein TNCV_2700291 [Trichonephila clavipes]|nr:uncharacterized protein TNCV_2700291 [Trichonephila clavipes]
MKSCVKQINNFLLLTKIGNGKQLDEVEITLIESPFCTVEEAELRTATAGSDVVQSGRQIFDDFYNICGRISAIHGECCLPNGQAFVPYPHRPMTLHSPTENSLAVLNHKILEANSQVQNVKLGGYQTCLSINRLWHELWDMLRRLVGTTAPGDHDWPIQE